MIKYHFKIKKRVERCDDGLMTAHSLMMRELGEARIQRELGEARIQREPGEAWWEGTSNPRYRDCDHVVL